MPIQSGQKLCQCLYTTTAKKTIAELRKLFAAHRLPELLVSDNGAQFTSQEFEEFLKANGIKHIRSTPYHPATNGEAERFVQTFKHAMKAAKSDEGTWETKLARFLLMYRSTPNTTDYWRSSCRAAPPPPDTNSARLADAIPVIQGPYEAGRPEEPARQAKQGKTI